jgi:hypothetical protein
VRVVGDQPEFQLLEEPPLLFGHWHWTRLEISIGSIDIDRRSLVPSSQELRAPANPRIREADGGTGLPPSSFAAVVPLTTS